MGGVSVIWVDEVKAQDKNEAHLDRHVVINTVDLVEERVVSLLDSKPVSSADDPEKQLAIMATENGTKVPWKEIKRKLGRLIVDIR